jgi:elongation factor G
MRGAAKDMSSKNASGPRCVALLGPYLSGKTTLLESILHMTGATSRKGQVSAGNTVGDSSQEARARNMSVETNVATTTFMGESLTFLDCPGSVEFQQDGRNAALGVDAAVVVVDAEIHWPVTLAPILKNLEELGVPTAIFVNKLDKAQGSVGELIEKLRHFSGRPLVMRHLPLRDGGRITGYIDVASERAYRYQVNGPSEMLDLPDDMLEREQEARYTLLETLADFDDHLMEELLEDITPPKEEIYRDLSADFQQAEIVPVFLGAAESDNGVHRLLKALRHETPEISATAERLGIDGNEPVSQVLKTYHTPHGGKLSVARVLSGTINDGDVLNGERVSGLFSMLGAETTKKRTATVGDTVALGRLEDVKTGDVLVPKGNPTVSLPRADVPMPIYGQAITVANRNDEVKLTGAIGKLIDEDASISLAMNRDTHELILWGQGEMHLHIALDRLKNRYSLAVTTQPPGVPYKEAIRKGMTQRGRFKRQTGGHGQFGDVVLDIKPLPRGTGFEFNQTIKGGNVPRQYIPSVEAGVKDYLVKGPLGFPVVDLSVTLTDGSYHTVDSSDLAFRTAGRMAMSEAMPQCSSVILEPILNVEITIPSEFTSKVNGVISSRRGQILGFDGKEGWTGWDVVHAHMPQSEVHDLIIDLRSLSHGVSSFTWEFDHLSELVGKEAEQVLAASRSASGA